MRATSILTIILLLTAGCVGPRDTQASDIAARPLSGNPPARSMLHSAQTSSLSGSGCEVIQALIVAPNAVFRPEYPPGISGFNQNLISASLFAIRCDSLWSPTEYYPGLEFAAFQTLVDPPPGGNETISNLFVHEAFVNDPNFTAAAALRNLSVQSIDRMKFTVNPNPGRTSSVEVAVPGETPAYAIRGASDVQGSGPVKERRAYIFGTEEAASGFFVLEYEGRGNSGAPGILTLSDESYWRQKSEVPAIPVTIVHEHDLTVSWTWHDL